MPITVEWNPDLRRMELVEKEIKEAVKRDAKAYYEEGIRRLGEIDLELKKGYSILDQQWTDFWRYYLVVRRGIASDLPLSKMFKTAMANREKWRKLYQQREILRQKLKQPRVYTSYFSDRPFG